MFYPASTITISKLETERRSGDWHDKPLRYEVNGPNGEKQLFSTKKDAELYKRIRATHCNSNHAQRVFACRP